MAWEYGTDSEAWADYGRIALAIFWAVAMVWVVLGYR